MASGRDACLFFGMLISRSSPSLDSTLLVLRDGTQPLTGPWNIGGYRIINAANPSDPQDYATKFYVDSTAGGLPPGVNGGVLAFSGGSWGSSVTGPTGQYLRATGGGAPTWGIPTALDVGAIPLPSPSGWGAVVFDVGAAAYVIAPGDGANPRQVLVTNEDGETLAFSSDVRPLTQRALDSLANAVTVCATFAHDLSAGSGAAGIGARSVYSARNSSGIVVSAGAFDGVLTTATAGAEVGVFDVRVRSGGTLARVARFTSASLRLEWGARALTVLDGGGSTEIDIFRVDGSNYWVYGTTDAANSGGPILLAPSTGEIILRRGGVDHLAVQSSGAMLVGNLSYQTTLRGSRLVLSAPVTAHDAVNNAPSIAASFAHTLSSGTPAAGIGVRTTYDTYNNGFTTVTAAATDAVLTQVASGFEQGAFDLYAMVSGALSRIVRIASSGLRLDWTRALTIINSGGSTELDIFRVVGGTNWTFGSSDGTNVNSTVLLAPSGGSIYLRKNSTDHLTIDSAGAMSLGNLSFSTTISGSRIVLSGPVTVRDTSTNAASIAATFAHTLSSGTAAAGIATRTAYAAQNASGTQVDAAYIDGILTTATGGAEVGALAFYSRTGGALTERMRVHGAGGVTVGTTQSLTSGIGFANTQSLWGRNAADSAWLNLVQTTGDVLVLGSTSNSGVVVATGAVAVFQISTAGINGFNYRGYLNNSSGVTSQLILQEPIEQTGTAGWTLLDLTPTLTSQGSGTKRAIRYAVSSVERFGINELGRIVNGNSANEAASATAGTSGALPAQAAGYLIFQDSAGNPRKIPYFDN